MRWQSCAIPELRGRPILDTSLLHSSLKASESSNLRVRFAIKIKTSDGYLTKGSSLVLIVQGDALNRKAACLRKLLNFSKLLLPHMLLPDINKSSCQHRT